MSPIQVRTHSRPARRRTREREHWTNQALCFGGGAYSGEVGHRFRLKWGSVGAKRRWYGHDLRSAPLESRFPPFLRANQHHFVSSSRFPHHRYSVFMWGTIPFDVGAAFRACGARFRCKRGTIPVKGGQPKPVAPPACVSLPRKLPTMIAATAVPAFPSFPVRAPSKRPSPVFGPPLPAAR